MKARANPTEIQLHDLPHEGREFTYTRESAELNSALEDLLGTNDYRVQFKLTPMGNTFDLRGEVETALDLQCSMCASDFKEKVKQPLHELLVVQKPLSKGDQQARANHAHEWAESGPDYILLDSGEFDVAAYIHEVIGLAEPIRPLCAPQAPEGCANSKEKVERAWLSYGQEQAGQSIRANPFQVLEKMKLKG